MADSLKIPYPKTSAAAPHSISRRLQEIKGVIAVAGSVYLTLALYSYNRWDRSLFTFSQTPTGNYGGIVGACVSDAVISFLGLSGYMAPLLLMIYGVRNILGKEKSMLHAVGTVVLLASLSMLAQLLSGTIHLILEPAGGLAGLFLTNVFEGLLSPAGAYLSCIALVIIALVLLSPVSIFSYMRRREKETDLPGKELEPDLPLYPLENEEILIESKPLAKATLKPGTTPKVKSDNGTRCRLWIS